MSDAIIYCHCGEPTLQDRAAAERIVSACRQAGRPVTVLGDLPALAADRDHAMASLAGATLLSPYAPRAVRWLIEFGRGAQPATAICTRDRSAEDVLGELGVVAADASDGVAAELDALEADAGSWRAWFPVLDIERCTSCGQCAGFCLFGVYERDSDQRVVVVQPSSCKNDCPACARVCPAGAIIFPKFPTGPINGGEDTGEQPAGIDVAKLVTPDVMDALRRRQSAGQGPAPKVLKSLTDMVSQPAPPKRPE